MREFKEKAYVERTQTAGGAENTAGGAENTEQSIYIQTVTEQIRCRRARDLVSEELCQHIADQAEDYEKEGMAKEAARREAVLQMGDPVSVGQELDRIHRPKPEWRLLLLVGILTVTGLFLQYVLGGSESRELFERQILYTELGIVVMAVAYFADYTLIGRYPLILYGGLLLFIAVGMISQGTFLTTFMPVNGRFRIYGLLILFVPLYAGLLYRLRGSGYGGMLAGAGLAAAVLLVACSTNSRTVVLDLFLAFLAMMTWAVKKDWFSVKKTRGYLLIYGGTAAMLLTGMGVLLATARGSYLLQRLNWMWRAVLHPEQYADSWGYRAMQLREATAGAQLIGQGSEGAILSGAGNGEQLSELFLGSVLSAFGLLAGTLLVMLLAGLLARMFAVALHQKNELGAMLSFGCACLFLTETIVYVVYNLGFTVFSPLYLPFLSNMGSGTISLFLLMGLVLCVYRNTNLVKEPAPQPPVRYQLRLEKIS